MKILLASAVLTLSLVSAQALAATPALPSSGPTSAWLAQTEATIAKARESNGLKRADKEALEDAQFEITSTMEGRGDFSELAPDERARVEKAQGEVTRLVARADQDEMVCRNVATTGTRHSRRECVTKAQHEARIQASREATRDSQRMDCSVGEGATCGMGRGGL